MTILELVTEKIKSLDTGNAAATRLCFTHSYTGDAEILIPRTSKGRELLKALLVEIGRHECELADAKKEKFVKAKDTESTIGDKND